MRISHFKSFLSCILFLSCPYLQAWESNSWKLAQQTDNVFDEVVSMSAYIMGQDNSGIPAVFSVSCNPSYLGETSLPSFNGPLTASLGVHFDVWFGYKDLQLPSLSASGRYQVDSRPTKKIKAGYMKAMLPEDFKDTNSILYHLRGGGAGYNPDLLNDLMNGEKFVLKPWEKFEITYNKKMDYSEYRTSDINEILEDANRAPLKNTVLRFSLNYSQKNIKKVLAFCMPYVEQWEKDYTNALKRKPK